MHEYEITKDWIIFGKFKYHLTLFSLNELTGKGSRKLQQSVVLSKENGSDRAAYSVAKQALNILIFYISYIMCRLQIPKVSKPQKYFFLETMKLGQNLSNISFVFWAMEFQEKLIFTYMIWRVFISATQC